MVVVGEKRFQKGFSELVDEFELESVADRILIERVVRYLIRIARAETYDACAQLES